jgi:hypothetical protein
MSEHRPSASTILASMSERAPTTFFLKGIAALVVLLVVTLFMAPRPEVSALRALIGVGLAIVVGKMAMRHYNIQWPPRRR